MCSNKILTIDDNYRRDSFEDRVCDDLCEVLLQFLPIKYKFLFECVSKQFQRNVFQRHEELNSNEKLISWSLTREEYLTRFE